VYEPLDDLAQRYPHVTVAIAALGPAHAALVGRSLLLVDPPLTESQRRSSIAHEIAHLDLGHTADVNPALARRQELEADHLAAQRLISLSQLADVVSWCRDEQHMAQQLRVSSQSLKLRLQALSRKERYALDTRIDACD